MPYERSMECKTPCKASNLAGLAEGEKDDDDEVDAADDDEGDFLFNGEAVAALVSEADDSLLEAPVGFRATQRTRQT